MSVLAVFGGRGRGDAGAGPSRAGAPPQVAFRFIAPPTFDRASAKWRWPHLEMRDEAGSAMRRGVFATEAVAAGLIVPLNGRLALEGFDDFERANPAYFTEASLVAPARVEAKRKRAAAAAEPGALAWPARVDTDPDIAECFGDLCLMGFVNEAPVGEVYNCDMRSDFAAANLVHCPSYPSFVKGCTAFVVTLCNLKRGQQLFAWYGSDYDRAAYAGGAAGPSSYNDAWLFAQRALVEHIRRGTPFPQEAAREKFHVDVPLGAHLADVECLAAAPSGALFSAAADGDVRVWDVANAQSRPVWTARLKKMRASADGAWLVGIDSNNRLRSLDLRTSASTTIDFPRLAGAEYVKKYGCVADFDLHADRIMCLDVDERTIREFTYDGRPVGGEGDDAGIVFSTGNGGITCVRVLPGGGYAFGDVDARVWVFDRAYEEVTQLSHMDIAQVDGVGSVAVLCIEPLSAGRLAVATADDGTGPCIRIWEEYLTGAPRVWRAFQFEGDSVQFVRNWGPGKEALAACDAESLRIWVDYATPSACDVPSTCMAVLPDGGVAVSVHRMVLVFRY